MVTFSPPPPSPLSLLSPPFLSLTQGLKKSKFILLMCSSWSIYQQHLWSQSLFCVKYPKWAEPSELVYCKRYVVQGMQLVNALEWDSFSSRLPWQWWLCVWKEYVVVGVFWGWRRLKRIGLCGVIDFDCDLIWRRDAWMALVCEFGVDYLCVCGKSEREGAPMYVNLWRVVGGDWLRRRVRAWERLGTFYMLTPA